MSGGQTLGSGVVQSAANNIAGFKRAGTSAVSPKIPNIAALLQDISTNIISQVENITGGVTNVIKGGISNVTNVFARKEAEEDPNRIMSEFLGLYQKALDYIRFFADPKQLKGFDKAIELYQDSLKSTGDTVVTIRKFIKKMINDFLKLKNELANLGGGGGFRLPQLPFPGRQPRQPRRQPRRPRTRMPRGRGGKLGLGLLGLGLLGGGLAAGSKFIGGNEERQQSADGISQELITKFDGILQRFDDAIATLEELSAGTVTAKEKKKVPKPKGPDADDDGGGGQFSKTKGPVNADLKTRVRQAESGNDYSSMYSRNRATFARGKEDITKMTIQQVHDLQTDYLNHQASLGYGEKQRSAAMGAYQMMRVRDVAKHMGLDPNTTVFNQETQDKMADYYFNIAGYQDFKKGKITAAQFNDRLAGQFASIEKSTGGGVYDGDAVGNNAYENLMPMLQEMESGKRPMTLQVDPDIKVKPDPKAQEVSLADPKSTNFIQQVPGSNNVAVVPSGGAPPPQTQIQEPAPLVASSVQNINKNLSPENPDNFLPLSAKQILNIVG
jgi:muramidase (phage lysozyme)